MAEGETPAYDGTTPTKPSDAQYTYTFSGWTPAVSAVTGNVTYTATYESVVNTYTINWNNADGTLLKSDVLEYGSTPNYDGTTPSLPTNSLYSYTFKGWTPDIVAVTGNATYTADYDKTPVSGESTTATGNWSDYKAASLTESTDHETIYISTAEELALYAWNVNEDKQNSKGYYCARTVELQADIDLSAHYWIPIGKNSSIYFNGKFHGNGHTITGLTVQDASGFDGAGLIGYLLNSSNGNSCVTNLTIKDCNIRATNTNYVGAIVGRYDHGIY